MNFILISLYTLLILVLLITVYQDIKQRTIHVALPVAIFILAIATNYFVSEINFKDVVLNILFIVFNITVLVVYFSIKHKKIINPIDTFIGLGDIVFFIAITPLFSLKPFVLFFIGGLVFSLLIHIISNLFTTIKTIPLAGYLSVFLIGYLTIRNFYKLIDFR